MPCAGPTTTVPVMDPAKKDEHEIEQTLTTTTSLPHRLKLPTTS